MSITSFKITDSDISSKGVVAAPTVLSGSPEENKRIFDRLVREVLKGDFNALVDALAATTGAGEIGAAVEGLTGETVQAILSALKTLLDSKAASADMEAALGGKSETSVTDAHFKSVAFDAGTGVFTFTKENGTTVTVDTALEKVAVNFAYDEDTQSLVLTLADGSTQHVSLAAFLTTTEFEDSNTIEWSVSGSMVRATIKSGSITDAMLSSTLKTMLQGYVSAAANSATKAANNAARSLSYQNAARAAAKEAEASQQEAKADADRAASASAHQPRISSDGYWELWDLTQGVYVKTAYKAQGPAGKNGDSYTVKGLYATLSALQAAHPTGSAGDAWFVGTAEDNVVYQWDVDQAKWVNVGALKGPQGADGKDGAGMDITGASVGQIAKITAVDENGKPTAWEPVDMPSGGGAVAASVEPAEDDIPKVFLTGTLPTTKDEVTMGFRYISKTKDVAGYVEIKCQGNSSMAYEKKNFTVKMFADEGLTEKIKVDFKSWGKQTKHVYKANWIDITHARNVVSARLWADVVKSRANYAELPELLRTSPNQGAMDGFPIKVYANGVYQGRYTLNIPKDKWAFNMDDALDNHCVLCGENYVSGCFRAAASINGSDWTDEIHNTVPSSIKTRWNEVISFVMNSTDDEFKANLGSYFDVASLLDYHLFGLLSCGLDAYGKNQIYMTYDGQKWIASMYDMDSTWGLWWNGSSFVATDYDRSEYQDFKDGEGNLLYIRLEGLFYEELQARWAELRSGALSIDSIINRFERFTDIAPAELVKEDYASTTADGKFTGIPSKTTNTIQQIRAYAVARHAWCDTYVAGLAPSGEVPCTGIALSASTLTFTEAGSQTLVATVEPTDTTDSVVWSVDDSTIATVSGGVVTAVANGSATITAKCGEYSATCVVSVSGIVDEPITGTGIFSGVGLNAGYLNENDGTPTSSATDMYTDAVDCSAYVGADIIVTYINVETETHNRIVFYDEADDFISVKNGSDVVTVPETAKWLRVSLANAGAAVRIAVCNNAFDTEAIMDGAYSPGDGTFNANDTNSCHVKFDIGAETTICVYKGLWGLFFFDSDGAYISHISSNMTINLQKGSIPEGAVSIAACTEDSKVSAGACYTAIETQQLGRLTRT